VGDGRRFREPHAIATIATVRRSSTAPKSKRERVRALPWAALLQAGFAIGRRWRALSEKDRARLSGLVRGSRGRLGNLSEKERTELRKLAGKLDLRGMGGELATLLRGGRGRRKRRRGRA
jgi:hypothetical protein